MNETVYTRRFYYLLAALTVFTVIFALWPGYRAFLNIEILYNEGWNAYYADAAMGRTPLYPAADQLITNNYPPLSFYAVGGLGWLLQDNILAGRLLSLCSVLLIGGMIGLSIKELTQSFVAAWLGTIFFIATMCRFFTVYVGVNDPQLLARAIMSIGYYLFLRADARQRSYIVPVVIMVVAGFFKHNIICMPLTALLWVGRHRPREAIKCGLVAGVLIAVGLLLCYACYGKVFFTNLLAPRFYDWHHPVGAIGHLQWVAVGLLAWSYIGVVQRHDPRVQLCNLFVIISLIAFFLQKMGDGVSYNSQFDLIIAVSISVGLAYHLIPQLSLPQRVSPEWLRFVLLLAICLRLAASSRLEPFRLLIDRHFYAEIHRQEQIMSNTIRQIQLTDKEVMGSNYSSYRSGKPFVVDAFNAGQRMKLGLLPTDLLDKRIAEGRLLYIKEDLPFQN